MPTPPRKPLMVNLTPVFGAFVLLVALYVASYVALLWCWGGGKVSDETVERMVSSVFAPLFSYAHSDRPGARLFDQFSTWCLLNGGERTTWERAGFAVDIARLTD